MTTLADRKTQIQLSHEVEEISIELKDLVNALREGWDDNPYRTAYILRRRLSAVCRELGIGSLPFTQAEKDAAAARQADRDAYLHAGGRS